jgi:hypothetical protein
VVLNTAAAVRWHGHLLATQPLISKGNHHFMACVVYGYLKRCTHARMRRPFNLWWWGCGRAVKHCPSHRGLQRLPPLSCMCCLASAARGVACGTGLHVVNVGMPAQCAHVLLCSVGHWTVACFADNRPCRVVWASGVIAWGMPRASGTTAVVLAETVKDDAFE